MALKAQSRTAATKVQRSKRKLTPAQLKVELWAKRNYGIGMRLAREFDRSPSFIHKIMYNRDAQSAGWVIERRLLAMGCPLIQKDLVPGR